MFRRGLFIITTLVVLSVESYALSPFYFFRNLAEQTNVSPSPSPSQGDNLASGGLNFQKTCNMASRSCHLKNIAACLIYSQSGPHEVCLVIENNDEKPLNVKIMILPANYTIKELPLPSHQMEKINMSSYDSSSMIAVNAGDNGDCILRATAPPPLNHHDQSLHPSGTYVTPTNGAYLVILLVVVAGGTFACFKFKTRGRHLDGVPYHELEMGNSTPGSSLNAEEDEEAESWDQDWDDAWGEEKTVKSVGKSPEKVKPVNGLTIKVSDSKGLRKEWAD